MAGKLETATTPHFTLTDAEGQKVTLSHYQGDRHVFLVLSRGFVIPVANGKRQFTPLPFHPAAYSPPDAA